MATKTYKVRAKRRTDGGYDLSYGKGKQKLTAIVGKEGQKFSLNYASQTLTDKISVLKDLWGQWAAEQYGRRSNPSNPATPPSRPPIPTRQTPATMAVKFRVRVNGNPSMDYRTSRIEMEDVWIVHTLVTSSYNDVKILMSRDAAVELIAQLVKTLAGGNSNAAH